MSVFLTLLTGSRFYIGLFDLLVITIESDLRLAFDDKNKVTVEQEGAVIRNPDSTEDSYAFTITSQGLSSDVDIVGTYSDPDELAPVDTGIDTIEVGARPVFGRDIMWLQEDSDPYNEPDSGGANSLNHIFEQCIVICYEHDI